MNLHPLKYPLSILLLGCAVFHLSAQPQDIALRGSVVLQNSKTLTGKTEYLPTVSVKSLKATPTLSDANGLFKLVFASVSMGAKTEIKAWKTGFTVVNAEVLKEAVIIGRTDTLKIVMCNLAQFEENKQRFYDISTENVQRELSRRVAKLQRANAQDKRRLMDSLQNEMNIKLNSSDDAIAQLNARSKALEEQLERIATDFATVNLDDASETYRLAYTAFTEGDVNGSLKILNAIDLKKRLGENVKLMGRRDTLISVMQRQNDTSRTQIAQDIQACLLAANNHSLLFQHREAQSWYETAIDYADTTNLTLLNNYTNYLYEFGEFAKATQFNDIALQRARFLRQTRNRHDQRHRRRARSLHRPAKIPGAKHRRLAEPRTANRAVAGSHREALRGDRDPLRHPAPDRVRGISGGDERASRRRPQSSELGFSRRTGESALAVCRRRHRRSIVGTYCRSLLEILTVSRRTGLSHSARRQTSASWIRPHPIKPSGLP